MNIPQPAMQPRRLSLKTIVTFIKSYWYDYVVLVLVAVIIVTTDQLAKIWVRANVPLGGDWLPSQLAWLMPFARIRYWYNSGAAFGFFKNGNTVFSTLAVLVDLFIIYYFPRVPRQDWWLRLAMGMQFAGATGNLVDRLFFRHVTDFISVGNFAIFNVADASISVGVAVLVVGIWLKERSDKKKAAMVPPIEAESKSE